MQVLSEEYQPFYSIIPQSEFITNKKTAHKRATSTYEGYSQNHIHYNTKNKNAPDPVELLALS